MSADEDWRPLIGLHASTEETNPRTTDIDQRTGTDLVGAILAEDAGVHRAVAGATEQIGGLVEIAVRTLDSGGRVHYVGSGTSGRLAVLDAAELLPTYGVGPEEVIAHLAGGEHAMVSAAEGAEDDAEAGARAVADVGPGDLVIGVTASGRTPYVGGALRHARRQGGATGLIATNTVAELAHLADVAVLVDTGPEAVTGSTRMKAGTAQKMVLNAFSTATMVRRGKTYGNLMTEVLATNDKLRARTVRMLIQATGADAGQCAQALAASPDTRTALVALLAGADPADAARALARHRPDSARTHDPGGVRSAVAHLRNQGRVSPTGTAGEGAGEQE